MFKPPRLLCFLLSSSSSPLSFIDTKVLFFYGANHLCSMAASSLSLKPSNLLHFYANSAAIATAFPSSPMLGELLLIRNSKAEGPLRRPTAPTKEAIPPRPSPSIAPPASASSADALRLGVTIEYQRQRAKELQEYFLEKKYEEQGKRGRVFGWVPKNEVSNGRWAMFGFSVGLLTEYATGSDFVDQLKIIISNLGIADVD